MAKRRTRNKPLQPVEFGYSRHRLIVRSEGQEKLDVIEDVAEKGTHPDADRYFQLFTASVDLLKAARAAVNVLRSTRRRSWASRNLETMLLAAIKKATPPRK